MHAPSTSVTWAPASLHIISKLIVITNSLVCCNFCRHQQSYTAARAYIEGTELDICEEMEALESFCEISALQVGDVSKPEKSMGSGSSDTAGKQSSKLSHQYWDFRKITTTLNSLGNRLKQAVSQGNRFKKDSIASQIEQIQYPYKLDFFLERLVPGAEGTVTDEVGANGLISALNVPSEIKAIQCSFSRTSTGAIWDEDIFKAIDAIGKCKNLEKLTIVGGLELKHLKWLCQSVQTSKVGHLEVNINMLDNHTTMTTVCKMVKSNLNLKHLTFITVGKIEYFEAVSLGLMLAKNSTLKHLDLGRTWVEPHEIEVLLQPLTGAPGARRRRPVNTSLKHISVPCVSEDKIGDGVAKAVTAMLTSNKTLTHLKLAGYVFSEPSDVCMVLQSLRTNKTLQTLDLVRCRSHFEWEDDVFAEMLHLTQANLFLKSIELSMVQFGEGHIEAVKAQLAANAIKRSGRNVENLREKALHNPMMPQFSNEIELLQEILECKPSDSLQIGLDNLQVSACESKSITSFLDFEIAIKIKIKLN